ncbi:MAG: recombination regulator RecX [Neisseria sp.]|nr:recombination regulator RecX [Neisseria sp.]
MSRDEVMLRAMNLLARREHSRTELRRKLAVHCEDADLIEDVLQELHRRHLQSDERFSESLINSKAKNYGSLRLAEELRRKGVDSATAAAYLPDTDSERQRALAVLQKKFRQPENTLAMKQKYYRFLAYRGFSADVVSRSLKVWLSGDSIDEDNDW